MATYKRSGFAMRAGQLNQAVAAGFGAVFVLIGLSGFVVSGGHHAVGPEGGELFGLFQVNVLHNVVHLVVGAVLIAAAIMGDATARTANAVSGLVYLALFVAGLAVVGTRANVIALNGADNALHLVLGLALTGVGFGARLAVRPIR